MPSRTASRAAGSHSFRRLAEKQTRRERTTDDATGAVNSRASPLALLAFRARRRLRERFTFLCFTFCAHCRV